MTRPCSGCGLMHCDGACYDDPIEDGICSGCGFSLSGGGLCLICTQKLREYNLREGIERDLKFTLELQKGKAA